MFNYFPVKGLRISNELGPFKSSMFNVQGTSEDEVKTRTIECKYGLKPSLTPEALAVGAYLPQKIFTRNNLSRNSVVEIVISPLDWGGAMKLFKPES